MKWQKWSPPRNAIHHTQLDSQPGIVVGVVRLQNEHLHLVPERLHRLADGVDLLLRAGEVAREELVGDESHLHRSARTTSVLA